jgi:16S rRNA processing protein RimM
VTSRRGTTGPPPSDPPDRERLTVGLVRGLHGLRGAVRVEVLSDDPTRFELGSVLVPDGEETPLTVDWVQADGPGILVRFAERPTRESVEDLRGRYLEAHVTQPLPDDQVYWHELIDVPVVTTGGEELGRVADVFRAGGAEVLVVRGGARGEVLVPVVGTFIHEFSPRERRIVVDADVLDLDGETPVRKPRGRRSRRAHAAGTAGATPPPSDVPDG